MFYVDINAEAENQQSVAENVASHNGNSSSIKTANPVMSSATKLSPQMSLCKKNPNELIQEDNEDDVNESLFPRCKSSKCEYFLVSPPPLYGTKL